MSAYTFTLRALDFGLLSHGWQQPKFVHVGDMRRQEELDVYIKSGDYFMQLATTLDALQSNLPTSEHASVLNRIVLDLLYLQTQYQIKKR